jgi:hypothetical protein
MRGHPVALSVQRGVRCGRTISGNDVQRFCCGKLHSQLAKKVQQTRIHVVHIAGSVIAKHSIDFDQ